MWNRYCKYVGTDEPRQIIDYHTSFGFVKLEMELSFEDVSAKIFVGSRMYFVSHFTHPRLQHFFDAWFHCLEAEYQDRLARRLAWRERINHGASL